MAVAFLPVFYSKHALNDVVTLAPITLALVASLFAYRAGRIEDWILAGGAIGVATATKYTAGAMLLTVVARRGAARPAGPGGAAAGSGRPRRRGHRLPGRRSRSSTRSWS